MPQRVGPGAAGAPVSAGQGRTREQNTAKVARRRASAQAERELVHGEPVKDRTANHLIPQIDALELLDDEVVLKPVGVVIGGVSDFKILRGATAILNLVTSTGYAHTLADAAMLSRGSKLVAVLYEISNDDLFGPEDDDAPEG